MREERRPLCLIFGITEDYSAFHIIIYWIPYSALVVGCTLPNDK